MAFEIIVCVSAYYICNQKTRFFEDVSTAPTVVLVESACFHTQQYRHCPFCRLRLVSQSSPRVPCTRLGQSSVAFPSSSPSPPWWCCTKTLLSDNTGLSSKSKHFRGKTWMFVFSISTPLGPLHCHSETASKSLCPASLPSLLVDWMIAVLIFFNLC